VPFSALENPLLSLEEPAVASAWFTSDGHWVNHPQRWDEDTPEKLLLSKEARLYIEKAIESLPPNQRKVITFRDIEGLSSEEVCNILELSETNQRVLLHRARSSVRRMLERYLEGKIDRP
jgi:RNA polymerase sigma-70 factor (ECF subfamily)